MTTPIDKVQAALEYALREDYSVNGVECCRLLQEALSELDGMVLVPIDPTEAMKWAVVNAPGQVITKNPVWNEACYAAMIAPYVKASE